MKLKIVKRIKLIEREWSIVMTFFPGIHRISSFPFILLVLVSSSHSWELRQSGTYLAPSSYSVQQTRNDVSIEHKRDASFSWQTSTEVSFASEWLPFRSGLSLGYRPHIESEGTEVAPQSIPVCMSVLFGTRNDDDFFNPYFGGRVGWIAPISKSDMWWEKPLNVLAQISFGSIFPYGFGAEITYDYVSLLKTFPSTHAESRIAGGRLAFTLSWGFIFGSEHFFRPQNAPTEVDEEAQMRTE